MFDAAGDIIAELSPNEAVKFVTRTEVRAVAVSVLMDAGR